jgi:hypothetical protein
MKKRSDLTARIRDSKATRTAVAEDAATKAAQPAKLKRREAAEDAEVESTIERLLKELNASSERRHSVQVMVINCDPLPAYHPELPRPSVVSSRVYDELAAIEHETGWYPEIERNVTVDMADNKADVLMLRYGRRPQSERSMAD